MKEGEDWLYHILISSNKASWLPASIGYQFQLVRTCLHEYQIMPSGRLNDYEMKECGTCYPILENKYRMVQCLGMSLACLSRVDVRRASSDGCRTPCGVPHGSILGPSLFVYVNHVSSSVKCMLFLYADD